MDYWGGGGGGEGGTKAMLPTLPKLLPFAPPPHSSYAYERLSICVCASFPFPFGFQGMMCYFIVIIPVRCLSFYFVEDI